MLINQKENISRKLILAGCVLLLLGIVLFQLSSSLKVNSGKFIYPLDDTYLHMAIAKNIAEHGVWGITKYGFSSTSSSIFYTLLLSSCFWIFGNNDLIALIISITSGVAVLFVMTFIAAKEKLNNRTLLILLLAVIFFTPFPVLMLSGMEHTIQISFLILFIYYSAVALSSEVDSNENNNIVYLLAPLIVMLRYESLFLIGIVSALFFLRKRYKPAFIIFIIGVLPVVIYGLISISKGSLFLPNTIAIKGGKPEGELENILIYYAYNWFRRMFFDLHLLSVFMLLLGSFSFAFLRKKNIWNKYVLISLIITFLFIAHLVFASVGWLYRYEAYLVALSIFSFVIVLKDEIKNLKLKVNLIPFYFAISLAAFTLIYPLIKRSYYAFTKTVTATKNIYDQHYQLAKFIKEFYPESAVAANDIGAISFFTDAKMLDLSGLGSLEVIKLRLNNNFNKESIEQLTIEKNIEIAILYDRWFIGKIPESWKKAGSWEIKNNVICADKTVSFYATSESGFRNLSQHLKEYSKHLPKDVKHEQIFVSE